MTIADWFKSFIYTEGKAKKEIDVVEACIRFIGLEQEKQIKKIEICEKEQNDIEARIEKYLTMDITTLFGKEKTNYENWATKYHSAETRMEMMQQRNYVLNNIYKGLSDIYNSALALVENGQYEDVIKIIPEKLLPRMIRNIKETENIEKMITELMTKFKESIVNHGIVVERANKNRSLVDEKFAIMNQETEQARLAREKAEQEKMRLKIQKKKELEQGYVRAVDMPITVEETQTATNTNTNKN